MKNAQAWSRRLALMLVLLAQGCTGEPAYSVFECPTDPEDRGYDDQICVENRRCLNDPTFELYCYGRCKDTRRYYNAPLSAEEPCEGDANPPGSEPQGACPACVPVPGGQDAPYWTERPELVFFGDLDPNTGELAATCPAGITEIDRLYDELEGTTECDTCACEAPEGACSGRPASIDIRAGKCEEPGALSMSFDGPAGWGGSCTNEPALNAGAECPAGSGTLCAQSVAVTALPPPMEKPCGVKVEPVPKFNPPGLKWKKGSLACKAAPPQPDSTCGDDNNKYCTAGADTGFLQCIRRSGAHAKCPLGYDQGDRHVMYPKNAITPGKCTDCICGEPKGGACISTLRLYADETCNNELFPVPLSSMIGQCTNFQMPGPSVGSKAITDIERMPGVCEASGGEPIQDPKPDPEGGAFTFCCRPLFDGIKG